MKVSVIIPSYNHARYLSERIESVLNQTFRDFEIIILDDCSTDNSRELIQEYTGKYPQIKTAFNERNSGCPGAQWNKGVGMATGEFVWIAESDDTADPEFLNRTVGEISKSETTGMIFTGTRILNEEKKIEYKYSNYLLGSQEIVRRLTIKTLTENPIPNVSSVLFRKEAFKLSGYADESMRYCGDWFLYQKILQRWDIVFIPEILSTFRLHKSSGYHMFYSSGRYFSEKMKIYRFILKSGCHKPVICLRMLWGLLKSMILRTMYFLRLPDVLVPELPRRPKLFSKTSIN